MKGSQARIVALVAADLAAVLVLTSSVGYVASKGEIGINSTQALALWPVLCGFLGNYYSGLYDLKGTRTARSLLRCLGRSLLLIALLLAVGLAFDLSITNAQLTLVSFAAIAYSSLLAHTLFRGWLMEAPEIERVLVLGSSALAVRIARECQADPTSYQVALLPEDGNELPTDTWVPCPVPGSLSDLAQVVDSFRPDRIIIAFRESRDRSAVTMLLTLRVGGIQIEQGVDAYARLTGKMAVEILRPSYLLFSDRFQPSRLSEWRRRTISIAFSVVGLAIYALLFPLIALAIKLTSPGPVLFMQPRIGHRGKPFRLCKFRTMHAADSQASEWVADNAARITPVGYWLRRFRIDELPQFWNILRGDMNLIGPRPHPVSNHQLFLQEIPYYQLRSIIRPGLTGWAQIRCGYANNLLGETEKMRYDLYYIANESIWFDLQIVAETVRTVLFDISQDAEREHGYDPIGFAASLPSAQPREREAGS